MWDSLRKILLGCGELWEPPQGLPRISRLELSKRFASPGNFTPLMFYFWGDCFLKESTSFKIFNPILGPNLHSFWEPCLFSGTYFLVSGMAGVHQPWPTRQRGFSETTCLTATEATALWGVSSCRCQGWRGVWGPWNMERSMADLYIFEWTWRMVFLGFFGGKKNKGWNLQP